MKTHEHHWAPTGLWIDGWLWLPCREPGCEAGLTRAKGELVVGENVFPLSVGGERLELQDDPIGGVVKIVLRELLDSYFLNDIPFEPGDVVLDVGAHVGVVSIYLAKKWPGVLIHAFEPMPENFMRLETNLKANDVKNVKAHPFAVSGNGRRMRIGGNLQQNSGGMSAFASFGKRAAVHTVESVTLAQIFTRLNVGKCKLLKMDCEGAEYEILRTSEGLLDRVEYLSGEFHTNGNLARAGYSPDELLEMCKRHIAPERIHVTFCRMAE